MKICIVGVGAIGGTLGFALSRTGHEVSGLARGATLEALRKKGLRSIEGSRDGRVSSAAIRAEEDPRKFGIQDLVVLAVKAPALQAAAESAAGLIGPDTIVMPAMNGVPWWFFQDFGGRLAGTKLRSTDPGGNISALIPPQSIIGCVIHLGASCPEPGLVKTLPLQTLIIGEPSGAMTERLKKIGSVLAEAGFEPRLSPSIQSDIWYKLWGNMTMNPLSALTGATMDRIVGDPLVLRLCREVMIEAKRVGEKIGCPIEQSVDDRIAISRTLGAFKTSMLQDVEAGRPLELDAILTAVVEIGSLVGEATPQIETLLGLTRLKARMIGLYPEEERSQDS
ncbi:MAG: 2-dehydropantoate 2-reductase [Spirochaetae bacterium HGW-Spirochaetae-9]|nr:MAG: 2-dehydropantoate 2-reductase [Spirochaetae bacterium HGW-Spirochaetae-9]